MQLSEHAGTDVRPEQVLQIASGFMAAKHLFTACELGLFEALADGPLPIEIVAARLDLDGERLRVIADANVALGLIEACDGHYVNSTAAQAFLAGRSPVDLRPLLQFWNRLSFPMWTQLEQSVRTGQGNAPDFAQLDAETQRVFSHGVEAISQPTAHALSTSYDFSRHRRVLDVAGGTGSFLRAILQQYPALELTLFELPGAARVALDRLAGYPIAVVAGDVFEDQLPSGHDAVILANVVHIFSADQNVELLRRVREALAPGGRVLLADFWLNEQRTEPAIGTLISGEFMTISGAGRSYSTVEATGWLRQTGFEFVEQIPLSGPQSLIVGEAR